MIVSEGNTIMSQHTFQDIIDLCDKYNISYRKLDIEYHIKTEGVDFDDMYNSIMYMSRVKTKLAMTGKTITMRLTYDLCYETPIIQITNMKGCSTDQLVDFYNKFYDNKYLCVCKQSEPLMEYMKCRCEDIKDNLKKKDPDITHFGVLRHSCYDCGELKTLLEQSAIIVKEQCKYAINEFANHDKLSSALKQFLSFSPKHIYSIWYGIKGLLNLFNEPELEVSEVDQMYQDMYLCIEYAILIQVYYEFTNLCITKNQESFNNDEINLNMLDSFETALDLRETFEIINAWRGDYKQRSFRRFSSDIVNELSSISRILDSVDNQELGIKFSNDFNRIYKFISTFKDAICNPDDPKYVEIIHKYNIIKRK
jgi:hypothetical protein